MKDVFIVSAIRTAVGRQRGYFREYMAPELLACVLDESVNSIKLDAKEVDDVITGCVYQIGEQGFNLARMAVLASNLPGDPRRHHREPPVRQQPVGDPDRRSYDCIGHS